jgi:D-beta-D-heptose 7-phosphate kinase/D-beta-D-heptose 1-phosphate adenosyltransferase
MDALRDVSSLLDRLPSLRIALVGDLMLDRSVLGNVERISPEAPIPVLRAERETLTPGGAGNVLRNLSSLGARVDFASVVGDDAAGDTLREILGALPGATSHLVVEAGRETTVKERFVAGAQQLLRTDRETTRPLAPASASAVVEAFRRALPGCDAVLLSDYAKGVLGPGTLPELLAAARDAGCPVLVDPKRRDWSAYRGAAWLTPNRRELQQAADAPLEDADSVAAACRVAIAAHGFEGIAVTRGADGLSLVLASGLERHLPARAREVFDVSGAGDTVLAVMGLALAAGAEPVSAARLANLAAGIVVGKAGTAALRAGELLQAIHAEELSSAEEKLFGLEGLLSRVESWRRGGRRVGFTNGCFDLLHPGHLSLLRQAKQACDRLVVALNSDASVRRLKGAERPVQGEAARAAVLASLSSVDAVIVFGDDTPVRLIEALRPDVLVKGADYALDEVVGVELVGRWGGRVVLAEILSGHSTSETVERLARRA